MGMPDMVVWVTKPGGEDAPRLDGLGEEVGRLDHVSGVDVKAEGA